MRRGQVEDLLVEAHANAGIDTFDMIISEDELPSVLQILKHLEAAGQFASYSRRTPQGEAGVNNCIRIYGYTG